MDISQKLATLISFWLEDDSMAARASLLSFASPVKNQRKQCVSRRILTACNPESPEAGRQNLRPS
jgi:hypothetical protein